ncbi:acetylornithine/N-succinyldiaminopimelate aminotransferase [Methanophagales archaeon]|nr:acetylornithine/N-succinyldiaminopimelate aminotransferase [Methanophagales archaeon]
MSQEEVFEKEKKYMMPVYKRPRMVIETGKGAKVKDYTGKEYIDCVAGIAVNAVGYSHPVVLNALKEQADKLMHVSNLYYTEPQVRLAEKLSAISGMAKIFFCNSGAESVEAALKLAIKTTGKRKFIATEGSFHGRTIGSLSATFGTRLRAVFEPLLLRDVKFVRYNDAAAIGAAIDEDTAAVILEPIQGESGVIVPSDGYLKAVRDICDDKSVLLILDEIQTGFGRTGKWFCKDYEGVEPDIMTLAKAMGAGFPIGAMLAKEGIEFEASEHGSTFGGNPLACATALAAINVIEAEKLVARSRELGEYFMDEVVVGSNPIVKELRGKGLMIAIELTKPCAEIVADALERGILINCTSNNVIRLVPPLVISKEELDAVISVLKEILQT